jgi:hypothetical protein
MPDLCTKCGAAAAPDSAFCGGCGTPIPRYRSAPLFLRRDQAKVYEEAVESTLDLRLENRGTESLQDCSIEARSPSLEGPFSRDLPDPLQAGQEVEVELPGFRPPKRVESMVISVSVVASFGPKAPVAVSGEFKVRVARPRSNAVNIINISGGNAIVDQARFGAASDEREHPGLHPPEWSAVPLRWDERRAAGFIPNGTPLIVRHGKEELTFVLGSEWVSFGRKKESNQVVVRVPGDDQKAVSRISRNHLEISLSHGRLRVRDVSSTGTLVNAHSVGRGCERSLAVGDRISLGDAAEFRLAVEMGGGRMLRLILDRLR